MFLNRLKGVFSCGQLLGCCIDSVQSVWVVIGACIVLTARPHLCRPTEAVDVFCSSYSCSGLLQVYKYIAESLFVCFFSSVLCIAPGGVHVFSASSRLSARTAASLLRKFTRLDVLPSPPLQAAGGNSSYCSSAPDQGNYFTGGLGAGTEVQNCLCFYGEIDI